MLIQSRRCRAKAPYRTTQPGGDSVSADAAIEFGRFRVLLRRRWLLANGVPVELGTRAFDLLLVLLEADGALVTKEELLNRVWPGIVVSEENLKVQICALRKALGADRNLICTEFGRGYCFIGILRSNAIVPVCRAPRLAKLRGSSNFSSAELLAIAPVWFQFELVTETSTNGDVVTAKPVRIRGLNIRYSRAKTVSCRSKQ
jgi:DNA-binding winged helix-turn-helix (wHTH) protein